MVTRRLLRFVLATGAFLLAAGLGTYAGAKVSESAPPRELEGSLCAVGGTEWNAPFIGSPGDARSPEEAALAGGQDHLWMAGWSDETIASLTPANLVVADGTATAATVWVRIDGQWAAKLDVIGSRGYWAFSNGISCGPSHGFVRWLSSL